MSKLSKSLPKRAMNIKLQARRASSWAKGQLEKALRIDEQKKREEINRKRGFTGKQLDNKLRAEYGDNYRAAKRERAKI